MLLTRTAPVLPSTPIGWVLLTWTDRESLTMKPFPAADIIACWCECPNRYNYRLSNTVRRDSPMTCYAQIVIGVLTQ